MTFHSEQTIHTNAERGTLYRSEVVGHLEPPRQPGLTREEMYAVLTRNSVGCVHHKLAEGPMRTSRVRYAREGSALFIPAWDSVESWYAARLPALECHVSEVDWYSGWRYVRLRGHATPLYPTGAPPERAAWRDGVAALRLMILDLAPMDELALANFGIVQMEIESWDGAVVVWDEVPLSSTSYPEALQISGSQPQIDSRRSEAPFFVQPLRTTT